MTSITRQYTAAASQASSVVEKAADRWTYGVRKVAARVPAPPQVDLVPAVERYFDLVQRAVDVEPQAYRQVGAGSGLAVRRGS